MTRIMFFLAALAVSFSLLPGVAAAKTTPGGSSITIAGGALVFKGDVTFTTTVQKLAGNQSPMIVVSCYQDVNGDGAIDTSLLGPDIVYSWVDHPTAAFSFSGQGQVSIWSLRGGGPAVCRADLDAYGWKGGAESVNVLASTGDFAVAG